MFIRLVLVLLTIVIVWWVHSHFVWIWSPHLVPLPLTTFITIITTISLWYSTTNITPVGNDSTTVSNAITSVTTSIIVSVIVISFWHYVMCLGVIFIDVFFLSLTIVRICVSNSCVAHLKLMCCYWDVVIIVVAVVVMLLVTA